MYRLGTRRSALAKTQSTTIKTALEKLGLGVVLVEIASAGDQDRATPLYEIETATPGLFTKQLEDALLDGRIDLAVHSLKDLPTRQPPGLVVAAVPQREDTADVLLIHAARHTPSEAFGLPRGARVGSSSLRREAELLSIRPDLVIEPLRGNVPTRLAAAREGKLDAVVLAEAGLKRLGLARDGVVSVALDPSVFVPAPGQGALAIEIRDDAADELKLALSKLHDIEAETETRIERRILRDLEGGCTLPLGVRCQVRGGTFRVEAFLGVSDRANPHAWKGFRRFDISGTDEETLVGKTVSYFKNLI